MSNVRTHIDQILSKSCLVQQNTTPWQGTDKRLCSSEIHQIPTKTQQKPIDTMPLQGISVQRPDIRDISAAAGQTKVKTVLIIYSRQGDRGQQRQACIIDEALPPCASLSI